MKVQLGCFAVFVGVFYLVGFGLLGYTVWSARLSTQAASWPTVDGKITSLSMETKSDSDGTSHEVKVEYKYSVDGLAYEGSRLAFGYGASSGRETHNAIHQKLKAARAVTVRYNPSDPTVCCLSFGLHRSIQLGFAFSITWLAFVFGMTLLFWLFSRGDDILLDNLSIQ